MRRKVESIAWIVGMGAAGLVFLGILLGSLGGVTFDAELTSYAVGSVLAAFAVAYRFTLWSQRPPTRRYLSRGWAFLWSGRLGPWRRVTRASVIVSDKYVRQEFIRKRSWYRWVMHLCLSGGCTLAFAITFPLVFGWVHFEPFNGDASVYGVAVFGVVVDRFPVDGLRALLMFNALNMAGVIVLVGVLMALLRRLTDPAERATQRFSEDFVPLFLILAVTVTGLALTVSYKLLAGSGHGFLAVVHLFSVLGLLFYIPFGKLFHMFQRVCSLCVAWYRQEGESGPQAACVSCLLPFASAMHVTDLKDVLEELGFNYRYRIDEREVHYQDVCPACRRRFVTVSQGESIGR